MSKFGKSSTLSKLSDIADEIVDIRNRKDWVKVYEMMELFLNSFELSEIHIEETKKRIIDLKEIEIPPTNMYYSGGYINLNYQKTDTILCDLNVIEIENFYPTITVSLLKKSTIKEKQFEKLYEVFLIILNDYGIFKWGTSNELKYYNFYKKWINMTFGYLSKYNQNTIAFYSKVIIKEILKGIESWIYIDTDIIYYYGDINYDNISKELNNLSFRTSNAYFGYFKSKKNYIIYDDNGFNIKGFRKWGETLEQRENIMNEIKMLNRDKKIDSLL